jgi:hypothetical protein
MLCQGKDSKTHHSRSVCGCVELTPRSHSRLKSGNVEAKYLDITAVSPRRAGEVRGASPRRHWQECSIICSKAAKILRPCSQQVKGVKDVNLSGRTQNLLMCT